MAKSGIGTLILSGSIALLAFLPAALSVMLNHYQSQRNDGTHSNDLKPSRIVIYFMSVSMLFVLLTYYASLEMVVHYTQINIREMGPILTPVRIAVAGMSVSVSLVTFALLQFVRSFFKQVDGEFKPSELIPFLNQ